MRHALSLCLLAGVATGVLGQDRVFSGPQPGEKLTPFKVVTMTGPSQWKEATLMGKTDTGPVVIVFIHQVTRPAFALIRPLDYYGHELAKKGLKTYLVWLTDDAEKTKAHIGRIVKAVKLKSPVAVSVDGIEGPGNYGLNRKVTLTILVGAGGKTKANFAIIQPNETDAPKILAWMAKLAGAEKAPTLAALREKMGIRRGKSDADELRPLMRKLIAKNATAKDVKNSIAAIKKWAGKNRRRWAEVQRIAKVILDRRYGTEAARAQLQELIANRDKKK